MWFTIFNISYYTSYHAATTLLLMIYHFFLTVCSRQGRTPTDTDRHSEKHLDPGLWCTTYNVATTLLILSNSDLPFVSNRLPFQTTQNTFEQHQTLRDTLNSLQCTTMLLASLVTNIGHWSNGFSLAYSNGFSRCFSKSVYNGCFLLSNGVAAALSRESSWSPWFPSHCRCQQPNHPRPNLEIIWEFENLRDMLLLFLESHPGSPLTVDASSQTILDLI